VFDPTGFSRTLVVCACARERAGVRFLHCRKGESQDL